MRVRIGKGFQHHGRAATVSLTLASLILVAASPSSRAQFVVNATDEALLLATSRVAVTPPPFLTDRSSARRTLDVVPTGAIALPSPPPSPRVAATPELVLRHLPNNIQGFRLQGEVGASEWPIYLSEAQTRRKLRFRVGYLSAVSVMPEASTLTVSVNDVTIGATKISAPNKVESVDFDIPADLVKPGFNAVRISVDQRHRVDCSLAATYELWTQIDPSQTGVLMPSEASHWNCGYRRLSLTRASAVLNCQSALT